jgi:hypothetical protein
MEGEAIRNVNVNWERPVTGRVRTSALQRLDQPTAMFVMIMRV